MGGQDGCERRIEVKKNWGGRVGGCRVRGEGGRVGGLRVDVNEELKFLGNFKKKIFFFFGGGSGGGGGLGRGGTGLGGQGGCV